MSDETPFPESEETTLIQEDSGLGTISINNDVVAMIAAMASKKVDGVVMLATGNFTERVFGGKKEASTGVSVVETEDGPYVITVRLILEFGVRLAKVAEDVQVAVRDQVQNMTNKDVARVDVFVDGVRNPEAEDETVPPPAEA